LYPINLEDEESCVIYAIDHDILFDENVDIQSSLTFLYPNFKAYFDHTFLEIQNNLLLNFYSRFQSEIY